MSIVRASREPTHKLPHAAFTSLATPRLGSSETSVWRVRLDPGGAPQPHTLTREEVFVVLAGSVRVELGAEVAEASAGDAIVVPPHTRLALSSAGGAGAELLCCLPVGGQAELPDGQRFTPPWAL